MPSHKYSTEVSFALRSEVLDPEAVTARLQIEPVRAFKKGDRFESRSGQHVRCFGLWRMESGNVITSLDIEPHVLYILEKLEPKRDAIKMIIDQMSATSNVVLWWSAPASSAGYSLSSSIMARLSGICQRIDFSFHYAIANTEDSFCSDGA